MGGAGSGPCTCVNVWERRRIPQTHSWLGTSMSHPDQLPALRSTAIVRRSWVSFRSFCLFVVVVVSLSSSLDLHDLPFGFCRIRLDTHVTLQRHINLQLTLSTCSTMLVHLYTQNVKTGHTQPHSYANSQTQLNANSHYASSHACLWQFVLLLWHPSRVETLLPSVVNDRREHTTLHSTAIHTKQNMPLCSRHPTAGPIGSPLHPWPQL